MGACGAGWGGPAARGPWPCWGPWGLGGAQPAPPLLQPGGGCPPRPVRAGCPHQIQLGGGLLGAPSLRAAFPGSLPMPQPVLGPRRAAPAAGAELSAPGPSSSGPGSCVRLREAGAEVGAAAFPQPGCRSHFYSAGTSPGARPCSPAPAMSHLPSRELLAGHPPPHAPEHPSTLLPQPPIACGHTESECYKPPETGLGKERRPVNASTRCRGAPCFSTSRAHTGEWCYSCHGQGQSALVSRWPAETCASVLVLAGG